MVRTSDKSSQELTVAGRSCSLCRCQTRAPCNTKAGTASLASAHRAHVFHEHMQPSVNTSAEMWTFLTSQNCWLSGFSLICRGSGVLVFFSTCHAPLSGHVATPSPQETGTAIFFLNCHCSGARVRMFARVCQTATLLLKIKRAK